MRTCVLILTPLANVVMPKQALVAYLHTCIHTYVHTVVPMPKQKVQPHRSRGVDVNTALERPDPTKWARMVPFARLGGLNRGCRMRGFYLQTLLRYIGNRRRAQAARKLPGTLRGGPDPGRPRAAPRSTRARHSRSM